MCLIDESNIFPILENSRWIMGWDQSYCFHQKNQIIPINVLLFHLEKFWMEWDSTCIEYRVSMENTSENMVLVQLAIDDSTMDSMWRIFGIRLDYWKLIYDDLRGIRWKWQSLDSVSVKAPLGGHDSLVQILQIEVR